ncbi:hypothetical protein FRACYDRAFT_256806 [Fragilariopsis cylindrus CCMP1102]|uniref:Uncharacterized protein n=1 Tax=Fragilariopsis cylindrus CCMP1102 TaxID=635003 RepID=A0A1E7EJG5_9STRA|nr:hypothetical protein FRACYDRAFT_256806 [Fragilariopsis cylindrus CCMP1102]|eukprot:OEU06025.1 hypothetical protein FRACYDRAFT_256806 [Fragilariopsis cylindrus CCMP1102]
MTVHFTGPNSMQEQKSVYMVGTCWWLGVLHGDKYAVMMGCIHGRMVKCLARVLHGDKPALIVIVHNLPLALKRSDVERISYIFNSQVRKQLGLGCVSHTTPELSGMRHA